MVFLAAGGLQSHTRIRDVAEGNRINWERLAEMAGEHRAAGAVSRAIENLTGLSIPRHVAEGLRRQRMVSDFHTLHLHGRLCETLEALAEDHVQILLLKGAAMIAASIYSDPTERPMADIDLLAQPHDCPAAVVALRRADWAPENNLQRAQFYAHHHHLEPFRDLRGSGHAVELHTSPFRPPNPFAVCEADLWSDATSAGTGYGTALVPSVSHMMVYACIHLAWSHMLVRGGWRSIRDVATLSPRCDWVEVAEVARRWKAVTACYWTLRLASSLAGVAVPHDLRKLFPAPVTPIDHILERYCVSQIVPGERNPCPSARLNHVLWRLTMRPEWSGHHGVFPMDGAEWFEPSPPTASGALVGRSSMRNWARFAADLLSTTRPAAPVGR
jgi:hypothetical protein